MVKSEVFLDTSVLFAGIWSSTGGSRLILKMGETRVIKLWISSQVLVEIENTLRDKAPGTLGYLALLLERSHAMIAPPPNRNTVEFCESLIKHPGDLQVIAAAWDRQVDYFVTLDRKHFIENQRLREFSPFQIGTPGDFLNWFRTKLS